MPFSGETFGPQTLTLFVPVLIILAVLVLRNRRPRPLRIDRLWIRPAIFLIGLATTLVAAPPPLSGPSLALLAAGLIVGSCLGWLRGRTMRIEVHPDTHDITARATPMGIMFILVLVVARMGMRGAALQNAPTIGLPTAAVVDALVLMAVGMMVAQGLEMWLRARRLLGEAQAAKSGRLLGGEPIVR
jgi:hypothetical protein